MAARPQQRRQPSDTWLLGNSRAIHVKATVLRLGTVRLAQETYYGMLYDFAGTESSF
jgi:hypothetical protein